MNESQLAESLAASGPAGAMVVFLGIVIRAWVARLETQLDRLRTTVDEMRGQLSGDALQSAKAITRLEGRVDALEARPAE